MAEYRTESVFFVVALILGIAAASVTTVINIAYKTGAPIGTTALAEPHEQLDRAPGEPLRD